MKTTLSERDGNTVKLEVEVSGEELQEAFDTKLKKLVREVRIPGFRPGKAPATMIRRRFGDEAIITDAVEDAMGGWFASAATELDLDPVEQPKIEIGDELPELGKPLTFTATVTVMPEIELGSYKGLEVPKYPVEVADQEVDAQIERLRNEFAELKPVTDRGVKTGDFVTADFRASLDGEPVGSLEANDLVYEVGAGRLFAEIEVNTLMLKPGEEKTFNLTIPEDWAGEDAAGKTVEFTVKVKEIKEKILPQLTDEWASEVSEFKTLAELRDEIRNKIVAARTYAVEQQFRAQAVEAAADNATLDLPDVVVTEQAQEMLIDFVKSMTQQGGDFRAYREATGQSADQMIEDFKPRAARNVKIGLMLDAVAKAEGLEVTEADVESAIAEMATASRQDAASLRKSLEKNNRLEQLRWQLLRDKAADFIAAQAVAVEAPAQESAAALQEKTDDTASDQEDRPAEPSTEAEADQEPPTKSDSSGSSEEEQA